MPSFNMYQVAAHHGDPSEWVPVEIDLTHEMHRRAEYGVAAHWKQQGQGQPGELRRCRRPGRAEA
ncbi:hypothetical protein QJS66_04205 [Kocuria rhizophila]|nr:hypothetical protein QJS66_04205 [Kocuria rhizophila]